MYIPTLYKNENLTEIKAFVQQNAFGILTSVVNGKPWATHIPLELEQDMQGNDVLYGHISKINTQGQFLDGQEVLAIFSGANAYVSSSWYEKEEVPTWNYVAVHISGKAEIIGEEELLFSMKKLVDKYEAQSESPVKIEELSPKIMRQIQGVIGFKIHIQDIQAAYKLSQNRNEKDYKNIIQQLQSSEGGHSQQVAQMMKKSYPKIF